MTSRERIRAALSHKQPDALPMDVGSTRSTGLNVSAYRSLPAELGIEHRLPRVFDVKQALALIDEDVQARFGSDARAIHRLTPSAGVHLTAWKETLWDDGLPVLVPKDYDPVINGDGSLSILSPGGHVLMKKPSGGLYFDDVYAPLCEAEDGDIDGFSYLAASADDIAFSKAEAIKVAAEGNCALVFSTGMSLFERGIKDFGFEEFMVRIVTEPDSVARYLDHLIEAYFKTLAAVATAFGEYIDVLQFNDDLGTQTSLMIKPQVYRDLFFPRHRLLYAEAKRLMPNAYILLHSCGSIRKLLPHLIEAGVDAINPVQISAADMEPASLKADFGDAITFWGGGCSTQTTLTFGTIADVRDEVRRMIDTFAPGGGFVFAPVHNIQANVPAEKIIALYDAALEHGRRHLL